MSFLDVSFFCTYEPFHEIMIFVILHKFILQTPMRCHPVGLAVCFWSDPSSMSILYECEQRRLWQACVDAQACMSLRSSPM